MVMSAELAVADPFATVVGQASAVAQLRAAAAGPVHAYLLVGPRGAGKRALARAFAAVLLADGAPDPARVTALAMTEEHPDLVVVERVGAAISAEQADEVVRLAGLRPIEGQRKVIVLDEFHLIDARVGPKLLKTVEEPPDGTIFVVLAEQVTPELVTIASRCVRIDVGPLTAETIAAALEGEGIDPDRARAVAGVVGGDLGRARLLAADPGLDERRRAWWSLPDRLDGTGAAVVAAVDDLLARIDEAQAPLDERHGVERAALEERAEAMGERGAGRKDLEARHKREARRHRTDEIRFGLGVLSARCRDEAAVASDAAPWLRAARAVDHLQHELRRNPNERLQLQALCVRIRPPG